MRALGANLGHLCRFLFAEAATIGGLSLVIGAVVGVVLAFLLVMLLGVIFTIPAHGLALPGLELPGLAALVVLLVLPGSEWNDHTQSILRSRAADIYPLDFDEKNRQTAIRKD